MRCPNCGKENQSGQSMCQYCGTLLRRGKEAGSGSPQTSQKAIWSLVLGILCIPMCVLPAIPAIILGVMALINIGRNRDRLKGNGFAIAGIVLASLSILFAFCAILLKVSVPNTGDVEAGAAPNSGWARTRSGIIEPDLTYVGEPTYVRMPPQTRKPRHLD